MKIVAPAKLNLSLRILGKREDGFHELETLMVPVPELADELCFEPAESWSLEVAGAEVGPTEDNLVWRAARLFEERSGRSCSYRVTLEKRIPPGAGLGGGSSDAAATLLALDELGGISLDQCDLEAMAAELGSDVPFFLRGGACWCRGRGEILEAAEVPSLPVLLLKPAFGVETADAYGRWSGAKELPGVRYDPQRANGVELVNDLERPVFEKFLFLAELKTWLREQFEVRAALMSGSGATVFAVLHDAESAPLLAERARRELDPGLWWWAGKV
jgi:4-diphosphocytidyl-2-C-methyl-D-erythritol kinase